MSRRCSVESARDGPLEVLLVAIAPTGGFEKGAYHFQPVGRSV